MDNQVVRAEGELEGVQRLPMRMPFRVLLGGIGALLVVGMPVFAVCLLVSAFAAGGWTEARGSLLLACGMSMCGQLPGWMFIRAARTGVDPESEDRALERAASRAMLAAVEPADRMG